MIHRCWCFSQRHSCLWLKQNRISLINNLKNLKNIFFCTFQTHLNSFLSVFNTPKRVMLSIKQCSDLQRDCGLYVQTDRQTHTHTLKAYQRLWPQSRGGSARRMRWETKGWHINWAQSPAAQGGCKDPCGSREAAVTTDTSGSVRKNKQNFVLSLFCTYFKIWTCDPSRN